MNKLTDQQKQALHEIRHAMVGRLKNLNISEDLLADKSLFQLLCLIQLLVGHWNYIGTFTDTCSTLKELVGDALWEKPIVQIQHSVAVN